MKRGDLREALDPILAGHVHGRRRLGSSALVEEAAHALADECIGLSCDVLARRLRRRKADVLDALRSDGRFVHLGAGRGSRWRVHPYAAHRAPREQLGTTPTIETKADDLPAVPTPQNASGEIAA